MTRRVIPVLVLFFGLAEGGAQTVEVTPSELVRVPVSGLGSGRYWQQLVITLDHGDAASDSTVSVAMPAGIVVADTDGDGSVADDIRVVYEAVGEEEPGFAIADTSSAGRIVVRSSGAATAGGRIYLQFPISVTAAPAQAIVPYGRVAFADPNEVDLEQGPVLKVVLQEEFRALGSMDLVRLTPVLEQGTDTTTTALGTFFPEEAQVLVQAPPDLVFDGGTATVSNLIPEEAGDGLDDNDMEYRFFWSPIGSLDEVDETLETEVAIAVGDSAVAYVERENGERAVRLLTRDMPAGIYYIYAVSSLTGRIPLARSRAVEIRHQPVLGPVGPFDADVTLDSGHLLDREGVPNGKGIEKVGIGFSAVDHDDELLVSLFYSERSDLETAVVVIENGVVSSLEGALPIPGASGLAETDSSFTWNAIDPELIAAGDYYVYAATTDGQIHVLRRSEHQVLVRHSPFLRLDALDDGVLSGADSLMSGGERPQRYVTFTWGRRGVDGDADVDDDALISLYYSPVPAAVAGKTEGWSLPGGAEEMLAALGTQSFLIAEGISEDGDRRADNQYVWDLWAAAESGRAVPAAGQVYYVYGIIEDQTGKRLVQMNGGRPNDAASRLIWTHAPTLRALQPLADVVLQPGRSGRVMWTDMDLDDDARIRVILSGEDHGAVSDYASVADGGWVVGFEDGQAAPEVDAERDLSEDSDVDYLDIRVEELGLENGTYFPYMAITDGEGFGGETTAWRSFGKIEIQGMGEGSSGGSAIRVQPQIFSMGTNGERQLFEVRVDAAGESIDLVMATFRIDNSLMSVVDQDSLVEGVQPFAVRGRFAPAKMVTNRLVDAGDGSAQLVLEYFEPTAAITGLDGSAPIAVFELLGREVEGPATIELEADENGVGISRLERDGEVVASPPAGPIAEGNIVSGRAILRGRIGLEGRTDMTVALDVDIRAWGNYQEIADSIFAAANDADAEREGVQVQLAEDGSFELLEVPSGRRDLHFHLDGYLDGWLPGFDLHPAEILEDLQPGSPGAEGKLLGGDVTGYVEADGSSLPDNEVTLADWDYVASFFGRDVDPEDGSGRADITGNGRVDIQDLSLVGANYLSKGPRPVYKRLQAGEESPLLTLERSEVEAKSGWMLELAVRGEGLDGVRALELALDYGEEDWEMVETVSVSRGALVAQGAMERGWRSALVLPGREQGFGARGELIGWRLRARREQAVPPHLQQVLLLDLEDRPVEARVGMEEAGGVLPRRLALGQNFPNPFNPETTIPLAVPDDGTGRVRLEIFDILGQRVIELWNGPLAAGEYRIEWDGRDSAGHPLGSGVYLYRLQTDGGGSSMKRMVLVR